MSPTEQWRYDTLVAALIGRSSSRAEYRRFCRLVAVLTAALPPERVTDAFHEARLAA